MRKNLHFHKAVRDRKWLAPMVASFLVSMILIYIGTIRLGSSTQGVNSSLKQMDDSGGYFVEANLGEDAHSGEAKLPRLAYLISGTKGDSHRMKRTLQALYHPLNHYLLHLDLEAPPRERLEVAMYVKSDPTFSKINNVHVVGKANLVTYKGPTMVACTLQAVAILLRQSKDWDWFINLSASDYPLVTQDDWRDAFLNLHSFGGLTCREACGLRKLT